jgi:hypothetical protein
MTEDMANVTVLTMRTAPAACPFCQSHLPPKERSRVSSEGWVIFFVLLPFYGPLGLIGLLARDKIRTCAEWGIELD